MSSPKVGDPIQAGSIQIGKSQVMPVTIGKILAPYILYKEYQRLGSVDKVVEENKSLLSSLLGATIGSVGGGLLTDYTVGKRIDDKVGRVSVDLLGSVLGSYLGSGVGHKLSGDTREPKIRFI